MKYWITCLWLALLGAKASSQPAFDSAAYMASYKKIYPAFQFDTSLRINQLSKEEKIEGLSRVWQEARFNFANFDLVPALNWDSLYRSYIPRVLNTKDIHEYYNILKQFNQHLRDGHSRIMEPVAYFFDNLGGLPLRFRYLNEHVLLSDILSTDAAYQKLKPGFSLEKIDGTPVQDYIQQHISPYLHFSTPQDSMSRIYTYELLQGKPGSVITLSFKNLSNKEITVSYTRIRMNNKGPLLSYRVLQGNIGYLALNSFGSEEIVKQFDSLFSSMEKTSALIIDVRYNGGGNSNNGHEILGYLTRSPFKTNISVMRSYHPSQRAWGSEPVTVDIEKSDWKPYRGKFYGKPVMLLTGPATYSAAEDFTGAFRANHFGEIIGETTGGSTGQPLGYNLPGGGIGFICSKRDFMADGTEFVGIGIHPHITVHPTEEGLRSGKDEVLEFARARLLKKINN